MQLEFGSLFRRFHGYKCRVFAYIQTSPISGMVNPLNTGNGVCFQETLDLLPSVGRPVRQSKDDVAAMDGLPSMDLFSYLAGRSLVCSPKSTIEPTQTSKSSRDCDFLDWETRFVDQALGEVQPTRLSDNIRCCADVFEKQSM
jgi:hypothetical protein